MALYGMDIILGPAAGFQNLTGLGAMFIRILLKVDIVDKPDDAPFFNILTIESCEMPHNRLHRKGVFDQTFAFHELV